MRNKSLCPSRSYPRQFSRGKRMENSAKSEFNALPTGPSPYLSPPAGGGPKAFVPNAARCLKWTLFVGPRAVGIKV